MAAQLYQVSLFIRLSLIMSINIQENRREYEKRVASIVEASWLIFSEETDGKDDGVKGETAE